MTVSTKTRDHFLCKETHAPCLRKIGEAQHEMLHTYSDKAPQLRRHFVRCAHDRLTSTEEGTGLSETFGLGSRRGDGHTLRHPGFGDAGIVTPCFVAVLAQ